MLLDLDLPGMGGIELLKRIRANPGTACLPVVILTGSDDPANIQRSYAAGAYGYVRKSCDPSQFMEKMYLITRYWFHANAMPREGQAEEAVAASVR